MRNKNIIRNLSPFLYSIKDHFRCYKKYYIVFSIIIAIGIITGAMTAFKYVGELEISHLNDKILVEFLRGNIGWFRLFLDRVVVVAFTCVLLFLFNLKKWLSPLGVLLLLYKAYVVGLNSAILIMIFNVSGIINVFIVLLPCNIIILFAFMGLCAVLTSYCFRMARYGDSVLSSQFWACNGKTVCVFFCLMLLGIILELIFLPAFCSAFLVIV